MAKVKEVMIISNVEGFTKGSERKVQVKCDICSVITETTFSNYYHSQERRNFPGTTFCRKCVCKISAKNRIGKPAHNKGKKLSLDEKGKNHPCWTGGRYIASDGYVMVHIGGDKKENGWSSYRKEHLVVIEEQLGRSLNKEEIVHHIDGQKQNNIEDNLWICNHSEHKIAHQSLQEIGYDLIQRGLIRFDRESGRYFLTEK